MRIAFVHPDLGIGGAERLVIDAAVGLQNLGHKVVIYTSYCDKTHCFDEARDGTLEVRVRGDTIFPANVRGRFAILCAMLRQIHLAITLIRYAESYDVLFIDQLSTAIPLLRYFLTSTRILFYCHFPDKLLSARTSLLKSLYRVPFDLIEEWTTGQADTIVVNSNFTASIFKVAFPRLSHVTPKVVYPCVDVHQTFTNSSIDTTRKMILSINRFERKKNLSLAVSAYAQLKSQSGFADTLLVIAGGHDDRVRENVDYHKELQDLCTSSGLTHETLKSPYTFPVTFKPDVNVYFLLSIPGNLKSSLLSSAQVLVYTPMHEHFGIVPIEASLARLPVLAQDNGGPLETVIDGVTGYLRPPETSVWSKVLQHVLFDISDEERREMGRRGRERVLTEFSQEQMAETLQHELQSMRRQPSSTVYPFAFLAFLMLCFSVVMRYVYRESW